MDLVHGIILGIIQGIAEWIPVSSEGQIMLAMIGWMRVSPSDALSYAIFLHLGTMSAVLIRFRREFIEIIKHVDSRLTKILIVSTLSTGITGIPLYLLFSEAFSGGREASLLIGFLLIATGLILRIKGSGTKRAQDMSWGEMVILGLAQGFSILPGVSRSGTTLSVLLMRGFRQDEALNISFMISVPAVLGAIALDHSINAITWEAAGAMLTASFITGYLSMDVLVRFAKEVNFSTFCLALGLMTLLLVLAV